MKSRLESAMQNAVDELFRAIKALALALDAMTAVCAIEGEWKGPDLEADNSGELSASAFLNDAIWVLEFYEERATEKLAELYRDRERTHA